MKLAENLISSHNSNREYSNSGIWQQEIMMSTKCNAHSNTTLTNHIGYLVQDVNVFNINKYFCIEFFDI